MPRPATGRLTAKRPGRANGRAGSKAARRYSSRATPKSCSSIWNRLMKLR